MDEMQNDLSQKIDNVQYAISRLTNLNTVQEKGKFPSQPHQNPKGIHEVEAQEGESSKVREVKAVITLRSGKEVDQPTSKPKHDEESVAEKEKMLRQVKVNIPLLDMIKQVPTYAKFLKDLCTVKRGLNVNKKAFLTEQVSAIIQCKSPVKYKDPGCPTISVSIGGTCVEKALLDLGASVNLLPYSVYKQLGLGELKPTSITLSLADRSVKIPRGMIEDVLVQVDKFYYPVDFVVLDTDPLNGVMQLTFGNMTLELNIFHLCKKHIHPEEEEGPEEVFACYLSPWRRREEILPLFNEEETQRAAKEEPPKLILKPLPTELKYAYLEEDKQCPVVISSALTIHQEDCLLEVLRRCKKAIGWQISDLKGINPLVAPIIFTWRMKLSQFVNLREDSPWVSPTQVVPKKSGITVVQNDKGEDVSTRLTIGWRVCIDYRRLNAVTRKDHFPLPFIDQCLRGSLGILFIVSWMATGYFQIEIDVEDQEKTTFTCPFGTYAYRRMPFGLCNAPATFQRCMLSIFSDMVERIMEVFMDDITIYGSAFDECLVNLEAVLNDALRKT
ncbi:Retrovirus-related Pol polyprotein from transposon 17.6 [Vitis vinifera]|uniref:Retrovirus-related Pol polyprotein from transposon 17.6 n=1 Tax=Vitis vinifera TaxID=29760 RepID=A0A438FWT4_VITVI|nr:Retrovirus-related Pol polyprotein from transposon 17.6 [Vitis vinifera]